MQVKKSKLLLLLAIFIATIVPSSAIAQEPEEAFRIYLPVTAFSPTPPEYQTSGVDGFFSGYFYVDIDVKNIGNSSYGATFGDYACHSSDVVTCINEYPEWAEFRITDAYGATRNYQAQPYAWQQSAAPGESQTFTLLLRKANGTPYGLTELLSGNPPIPVRTVQIVRFDVTTGQSAQISCPNCP